MLNRVYNPSNFAELREQITHLASHLKGGFPATRGDSGLNTTADPHPAHTGNNRNTLGFNQIRYLTVHTSAIAIESDFVNTGDGHQSIEALADLDRYTGDAVQLYSPAWPFDYFDSAIIFVTIRPRARIHSNPTAYRYYSELVTSYIITGQQRLITSLPVNQQSSTTRHPQIPSETYELAINSTPNPTSTLQPVDVLTDYLYYIPFKQ